MMKHRPHFPIVGLLALAIVAGTSCANPLACDPAGASCASPRASTAVVGQDFELAPGGFATVSGTMLIVSFRNIVADSRCPTDVVCVWAGSASADLRVDLSDAVMWSGPLHTTMRIPNRLSSADMS